MHPVLDLITIDDTLEALALRAALEWWGFQVRLHLIGKAQDLVDLMSPGDRLSNTLFLMCHGDERGIRLPELGAEIESAQPYHGAVRPSDVAVFARLPGRVAISTGCATGTPAFAEAWLGAGCRAYIGPDGYPHGDASLFYGLHLSYAWLCRGRPLAEAHALASAHDAETRLFRLYEATAA